MQARSRSRNCLNRYEASSEYTMVTLRIDIDQRNYSWSIPEESHSIVHEKRRGWNVRGGRDVQKSREPQITR